MAWSEEQGLRLADVHYQQAYRISKDAPGDVWLLSGQTSFEKPPDPAVLRSRPGAVYSTLTDSHKALPGQMIFSCLRSASSAATSEFI